MKAYTEQDFKIDIEWLRELGVDTHEINDFLIGIIKKSFILTKEEFVNLMGEVQK